MRYRLRTLLILLAVMPLLGAIFIGWLDWSQSFSRTARDLEASHRASRAAYVAAQDEHNP